MKRSAVTNFAKALLFAICLALLLWMVLVAGPEQLWQTLISMPWTIAGCVAIWGIGYLLNAESFRLILHAMCESASADRKILSRWKVLRLTIAGYAINYITPFGLLGGEPYRVIALRPVLGAEKATQSVLLYSMMHIGSHFCLWLLAIAWAVLALREQLAGYWTGLVVTLIVLCALLALMWYCYRHGVMLRFMKRWVDWPLLNPSLLPTSVFVRSLLLELISRLANICEYWLVMQALGFDQFGYADALLVVAFSSLLMNILFFSPLQMGTREGGIMLALQLLVPSVAAHVAAGAPMLAIAVALSFATRLREFIWIVIGIAMLRMKETSDKEKIEKTK